MNHVNANLPATKPSKHRSCLMRFVRGVGWTLLGLVALVLILAVLGMIIPPPRDSKATALDDEDFDLGFKVGDKWDPEFFESAIKQRGLDVTRMPDIESYNIIGAKKEEFPFYSAFWITRDGCINIETFSWNKKPDTRVRSIGITTSLPSDWGREKTRAFYKSAKRQYSDENARNSYISGVMTSESVKRYPQLETAKGLGLGSSFEDFTKLYGQPSVLSPYFAPTNRFASYFGDRQYFTLFLDSGLVTSISFDDYPSPKAFKWLYFWSGLVLMKADTYLESRHVGEDNEHK